MNYRVDFVPSLPDPQAFEDLMVEYYGTVLPILAQAGGPVLSPHRMAADTMAHMGELLPPDGRTLLATDATGALAGCGVIRRIRPDAAELKRMYVRPEARGTGLGRRIFEMRVAEARAMGCRTLYADTVRGNRPMLRIYEQHGFRYVDRYPGNANTPEMAPFLVFLEYTFPE